MLGWCSPANHLGLSSRGPGFKSLTEHFCRENIRERLLFSRGDLNYASRSTRTACGRPSRSRVQIPIPVFYREQTRHHLAYICGDEGENMSDRTDRLLAVIVVLLAVLVVAQTTVSPRNQLLGSIGILFAGGAIVYALAEIAGSF